MPVSDASAAGAAGLTTSVDRSQRIQHPACAADGRVVGTVVKTRPLLSFGGSIILPIVFLGLPISLGNVGLLRHLSLGLVALVLVDLVVGLIISRSVTVSATLPRFVETSRSKAINVTIGWPLGRIVGAHFSEGLRSTPAFGPPGDGVLAATCFARGSHRTVTLRVVTGGFFSLVLIARDFEMTPVQPLLVIPAPQHDPTIASIIEQRISTDSTTELVGVRPYREGDRRMDLHWPSIARTGEVMVRDRGGDGNELRPLLVVASALGPDGVDSALGLARFAVEHAAGLGLEVQLGVATPTGPIVASGPASRAFHEALAHGSSGPASISLAAIDPSTVDVLTIDENGAR